MSDIEYPSIKVRMSPEIVALLSEGRIGGLRWDFGEPDADGFYEPTVYPLETPAESAGAEAAGDE